ncbi:hypothetical protein lerEdw1_018739 [Lerista edwardsae]|nr:hypothetical protein lerEdw1_018739 [Lerista edwardsae]
MPAIDAYFSSGDTVSSIATTSVEETTTSDIYFSVGDTAGRIATTTASVEEETTSFNSKNNHGSSDYKIHCQPGSNESSCVCPDGYKRVWEKKIASVNIYSCEQIPYGCKLDTMRENAAMCSNTTKEPTEIGNYKARRNLDRGSLSILLTDKLHQSKRNLTDESTNSTSSMVLNNLNHGDKSLYCSALASTFQHLQSACDGNSSATSLEDTAESFENLVNRSLSSIETKEEIVSVVTLVLESLSSIALRRAYASPNNSDQTVVTDSIVIQTQLINKEHILQNKTVRFDAQGDQMDIHAGAVTSARNQDSVAVAFISVGGLESLLGGNFLQNETLQSDRMLESIHVNSRVVSASTSSQTRNLSSPINLTFSHLEDKNPQETVICVHLNSAVGKGTWSPEGCHNLHSNSTHSKCSCQYLSSFAVLMATVPEQGGLVLFLISSIGLIISLICLFLCIVTFIFCHSAQNSSTFIHLQLSLCLFFADLFFITGIDKNNNKVLCSVIAGLLQYLFLACFVWMFLEGVNLYLIVKNLKTANYGGASKYVKGSMYICGYGLPAVIVGISAAVVPGAYGTHYHCWLSSEKGFIWSFMGPVCVIIVFNTVFFCLVLKILREKLASLNSKVSTLKNTRSLTFKAIAHLFILGLTWCLGLFQFGPLREVMEYLFTLTNSVQGVFIFMVHCLLNKKVREAYWRLICCRKDTKPSDTEMTMTSTPSSVPVVNIHHLSGEQQKMTWDGDSSSDIPPH